MPEYFLGNDESNAKLYALYDRILAECVSEQELQDCYMQYCVANPDETSRAAPTFNFARALLCKFNVSRK